MFLIGVSLEDKKETMYEIESNGIVPRKEDYILIDDEEYFITDVVYDYDKKDNGRYKLRYVSILVTK